MLWTTKLFGVEKPIIAMLHLDPLPGDPRWRYGDTMESVVQHALTDLKALQDGGVDGILISNEFPLRPVSLTRFSRTMKRTLVKGSRKR